MILKPSSKVNSERKPDKFEANTNSKAKMSIFYFHRDMGENEITLIPQGLLQNCPSLKQIEFKNNPIRDIEPNAFVHLPWLQKLVISEARELTTFPNLNGTHSLDLVRLDRSKIKHIPYSICLQSPNLRSLELKSNHLEEVPDLQGCGNLRVL